MMVSLMQLREYNPSSVLAIKHVICTLLFFVLKQAHVFIILLKNDLTVTFFRIECGDSPYGLPFHKTQHAAHHRQMKDIFCDGAAIRAGKSTYLYILTSG